MSPRVVTIRLARGDVSAIRVVRGRRGARLLVYQDGEAAPLVQARLGFVEVEALRRALTA